MKTPKEWRDLVAKKQVTELMIGQVLFSINKRAKNYREQKRKYQNSQAYFATSYLANYEEKKATLYQMKKEILAVFSPTAIHTTLYTHDFIQKVYQDEVAYQALRPKDVLYTGFSQTTGLPFKAILITRSRKVFFLLYEIAGYSFHQPIEKEELAAFPFLKQYALTENFQVAGQDPATLLSLQFCRKVHQLMVRGDFTIVS